MGDALIIDLDDDVIDRLRARAAGRRSLEEEVVVILTDLARGGPTTPENC